MAALRALLKLVDSAIERGETYVTISEAENDAVMADPAIQRFLNSPPTPALEFPGVEIRVCDGKEVVRA